MPTSFATHTHAHLNLCPMNTHVLWARAYKVIMGVDVDTTTHTSVHKAWMHTETHTHRHTQSHKHGLGAQTHEHAGSMMRAGGRGMLHNAISVRRMVVDRCMVKAYQRWHVGMERCSQCRACRQGQIAQACARGTMDDRYKGHPMGTDHRRTQGRPKQQ